MFLNFLLPLLLLLSRTLNGYVGALFSYGYEYKFFYLDMEVKENFRLVHHVQVSMEVVYSLSLH